MHQRSVNVNRRSRQSRSRQSSLAAHSRRRALSRTGLRRDRCRRSAPRTGLQTRRECFGRCSIERSTPAADDRAARGGGGSRHRGHALFDGRQEVSAARGNGERGALSSGLKGQRGASDHAEHANFARDHDLISCAVLAKCLMRRCLMSRCGRTTSTSKMTSASEVLFLNWRDSDDNLSRLLTKSFRYWTYCLCMCIYNIASTLM